MKNTNVKVLKKRMMKSDEAVFDLINFLADSLPEGFGLSADTDILGRSGFFISVFFENLEQYRLKSVIAFSTGDPKTLTVDLVDTCSNTVESSSNRVFTDVAGIMKYCVDLIEDALKLPIFKLSVRSDLRESWTSNDKLSALVESYISELFDTKNLNVTCGSLTDTTKNLRIKSNSKEVNIELTLHDYVEEDGADEEMGMGLDDSVATTITCTSDIFKLIEPSSSEFNELLLSEAILSTCQYIGATLKSGDSPCHLH